MKKIYWLGLLIGMSVLLTGCGKKITTTKPAAVAEKTGKCQTGEVSLENYGDKGKRLSNCFVEYPGEPTRQDKSYYVVEDICGQFTSEFVENVLGKPIIRTEPPKLNSLYNCSYYLNDQEYVMLVLDYLSIDNQKKGQEMMGRTTKEDPRIPMRNMVVYQEDGVINTIYLVFGDEKFISIERSGGSGLSAEELINFAANIAKEIKDYK